MNFGNYRNIGREWVTLPIIIDITLGSRTIVKVKNRKYRNVLGYQGRSLNTSGKLLYGILNEQYT